MEDKITTVSAHSVGRGCCDFVSPTQLLTCGEDGSAFLFSVPLEDPGQLVHADHTNRQYVTVAVNPANPSVFALAKEEGGFNAYVQLYELTGSGEAAIPGIRLTQTALGICDIAWMPSGKWLAVATESDGIRAMSVDDPVGSIKNLKDHQGAVKSVAFDPRGDYLASIGADGSLCIYSTETWKPLRHMQRFCERDNSAESALLQPCKLAWSPDGSQLAVPGAAEIRILARGEWEEDLQYETVGFSSTITLTAFSSTRLAACCAGDTPRLVIWNSLTRKIEFSFENFDRVSFKAIKFSVSDDNKLERLIGINSDGELVQYDFPMLIKSPTIQVVSSVAQSLMDSENDQNEAVSATIPMESSEQDEVDAPEMEPESILDVLKEHGRDEDGNPITVPRGPSAATFGFDQDDDNDDDLGDHPPGRAVVASVDALEEVRDELERLRSEVDRLSPPQAREPFQPGATAFGTMKKTNDEDTAASIDDEDNTRRFLAWNNIGTIVCRKDRERQSIEIDFADSSQHRPIRFTDTDMLDMGSLSQTGALFSASGRSSTMADDDLDHADNESRTAVLHYRAFGSSSLSSNWRLSLAKRELVTAVACGDEFCAASTSKGFLRVFRPSGLQDPIYLLPGPILSMTATGSLLLILYHTTIHTIDHELGYQLLDFGKEDSVNPGFKILSSGALPCEQGLTWCGFADESLGYMPLVYRKDGVLLGLKSSTWTWIVLSDGSGLERNVKLWPISASKTGGMLAVALRNKRRQPSVVPRSTPALFPIKIPILREKKSLKYDYEESALNDAIALEQRRWAGIDTEEELLRAEALADVATLRAIVVSLKLKESARAFGLCARLRMPKSLEMALQKAQEAGANEDFLERLVLLVDERKEQEEDDEAAFSSQRSFRQPNRLPKRRLDMEEDDAVDNDLDDNDDGYDSHQEVQTRRMSSNSLRVEFESPKKRARSDSYTPQSPALELKNRGPPPNPFLKVASPIVRDKKLLNRSSPIRIPELSREASFTVEVRDKHRRGL